MGTTNRQGHHYPTGAPLTDTGTTNRHGQH